MFRVRSGSETSGGGVMTPGRRSGETAVSEPSLPRPAPSLRAAGGAGRELDEGAAGEAQPPT